MCRDDTGARVPAATGLPWVLQVKRLLYGFVDAGLFLELSGQETDFELGGLGQRTADWHCPPCHHQW